MSKWILMLLFTFPHDANTGLDAKMAYEIKGFTSIEQCYSVGRAIIESVDFPEGTKVEGDCVEDKGISTAEKPQ